uniref:Uncharacterized protein n=1 Tax=Bionectria ochroleuca TaxID=29856 RepID=A0A0B7JZS1_BIOOC
MIGTFRGITLAQQVADYSVKVKLGRRSRSNILLSQHAHINDNTLVLSDIAQEWTNGPLLQLAPVGANGTFRFKAH